MAGKIDKTVTVGKFKGGEAAVRAVLTSQGFEAKTMSLTSSDKNNETWNIVLANGRKVTLSAPKKGNQVTIKEA
jgi:hypothetical protein